MRTFLLIWLGQVISLFGSKLTEFSLGVWVLERTHSATQFALIVVLIFLPNVLISPLAGALVDRWDRRWAMILSDSGSGIVTLTIMGLVFSHRLEIWHIYLAVTVSSLFNAFQLPAYTATIAQLVSPKHYIRANGMVQISKAIARILAPVVAGVLVGIIGLKGILLTDCSTFTLAIVTLLIVRFPKLKQRKNEKKIKVKYLWREISFSWHYITKRPGLVRLLAFVAVTYFSIGILEILVWVSVTKFSSSAELGIVLSLGGCGMLLGSLVISVWGGPKRRIYAILSLVPFQGILVCLCGLQASVPFIAFGIFGYLFAQPIIESCNRSIWQSKIPFKLQGRVFAVQQMVEYSLSIIARLIVGPLIDYVFEPLMATDGLLANSLGRIMGVGPGRGIALLFLLVGILNILVSYIAYQEPRLRQVEQELPDAIVPNLKSCV